MIVYMKFRNVSKTIGKATVLDGITYQFISGNVYGLNGKNGAGKTMLMRLMCGLVRPSSGEIEINGEILGKDISFPRSVGVLIENPAFLPSLTGFRNLELISKIQGVVSHQDVQEIIQKVGLDPFDKKPYRKYSLGMKQKLGIASAFLGCPELIILDEPINALDERSIKYVNNLINEVKSQSIIVVACHDKEELNLLSDTILYLDSGRIVSEEIVANH